MYKGTVSSVSYTANSNIAFKAVYNTNENTSPTTDGVQILEPGIYNIACFLNLTGVAVGNISGGIFVNGTELAESVVSVTSNDTTDCIGFSTEDCIVVRKSAPFSYATVNVQLTGAATISNGLLTIQKLK